MSLFVYTMFADINIYNAYLKLMNVLTFYCYLFWTLQMGAPKNASKHWRYENELQTFYFSSEQRLHILTVLKNSHYSWFT